MSALTTRNYIATDFPMETMARHAADWFTRAEYCVLGAAQAHRRGDQDLADRLWAEASDCYYQVAVCLCPDQERLGQSAQ